MHIALHKVNVLVPSVVWHPQTGECGEWAIILAGSLSAIPSRPLGKLRTYGSCLASLVFTNQCERTGLGTANL